MDHTLFWLLCEQFVRERSINHRIPLGDRTPDRDSGCDYEGCAMGVDRTTKTVWPEEPTIVVAIDCDEQDGGADWLQFLRMSLRTVAYLNGK
jgi:hypothetical protein